MGLLTSEAVRSQAGKLTDQIDSLERQITAATGTDPLARLAQAGDVAKAVERMSLRELREAISALMIVRILPAGKGIRFSPESGPGRLEVGMTETFIPACTGGGEPRQDHLRRPLVRRRHGDGTTDTAGPSAMEAGDGALRGRRAARCADPDDCGCAQRANGRRGSLAMEVPRLPARQEDDYAEPHRLDAHPSWHLELHA